jgi:carboxyl-terminal processing protease
MAHLRIAGFSHGVGKACQKALEQIRQADAQGIVLDLRNDPGGVLDEAVQCTSQFLKSGNVLMQKDGEGKTAPVPVRPGGVATDMPLVVLINRGTASASEVMVGALQDAKRAPIVGETSFGTGTVLAQFPLSDGSALLIAVREWLTPNGNTIWHKGIVPDVSISASQDFVPTVPEEEKNMSGAQLQATGDEALLRAVEILSEDSAHQNPTVLKQKAGSR